MYICMYVIICCPTISIQQHPCLAHSKVEAILGGRKDRTAWIPRKGWRVAVRWFHISHSWKCSLSKLDTYGYIYISYIYVIYIYMYISKLYCLHDSGWILDENFTTTSFFVQIVHPLICDSLSSTKDICCVCLPINNSFAFDSCTWSASTSQSVFWTWPSYTLTVLCL